MTQQPLFPTLYRFDGATYEPEKDQTRLSRQMDMVVRLMSDGTWRSLEEVSAELDIPTQSASARLRDLRKKRFGYRRVDRRRRGGGTFEYRVIP
jgi:predicted transcriptional regulator